MTEFSELFRGAIRLAAEYEEQRHLAICLENVELATTVLGLLTKSADGMTTSSIAELTVYPHDSVLRFLESAKFLGNVRKRNAIRWEIAWPEGFKYRQETP